MSSHDGGILDTRVILLTGIGKHVVLVEGHDEHCRCTISARSECVNLSNSICRLYHIDVLLLQILGRGSQSPGLQNTVQLFLTNLTRVKLLAGVPALW